MTTFTAYFTCCYDYSANSRKFTLNQGRIWCGETCWVFVSCSADIPEEEARYWAKKLEQLNAMRDQDVRSTSLSAPSVFPRLFIPFSFVLLCFLSISFFILHTPSNYTLWLPIWAHLPSQYFFPAKKNCWMLFFFFFNNTPDFFSPPQYAYQEEQERPLHAPSTQCCESSVHLLLLFCPFHASSFSLLHHTDSYWEQGQTGCRNEADRWGNGGKPRDGGKLMWRIMHASLSERWKWLIGARCVMNANWHKLGCQTRTALPDCLSSDDDTGGEQVDKCVGCKSVDRMGWLVGGMMLVCAQRWQQHVCVFSVLRYLAASRPAAFAQKLIFI